MSNTSEIYLLVFGSIGWVLSLYFGFFRFKQYRWTKQKVQADAHSRISKKGQEAFQRLIALNTIKNRGAKAQAKRKAFMLKWLTATHEKMEIIRAGGIPNLLRLSWLRETVHELKMLTEQDAHCTEDLKILATNYHLLPKDQLAVLLACARQNGATSAQVIANLNSDLTSS